MKSKKIDRILEAVHRYWELQEEVGGGGMVANAPGSQGGFGASADAKGPVAGYSNPLDLRTKGTKKWNPFFKNLARRFQRKPK